MKDELRTLNSLWISKKKDEKLYVESQDGTRYLVMSDSPFGYILKTTHGMSVFIQKEYPKAVWKKVLWYN